MIELNGHPLSLAEIAAVAIKRDRVQISAAARPRIDKSRRVVEDIVARDAVVYGVTHGFRQAFRSPHRAQRSPRSAT